MDAIEREVAKVVRTGCARLPLSCTRSIEEPISGTGSPPVRSVLSVAGEIEPVDRRYNHRGISPASPSALCRASNGIFDSRLHVSVRVLTRFASHYVAFPFVARQEKLSRASSEFAIARAILLEFAAAGMCTGTVRRHRPGS